MFSPELLFDSRPDSLQATALRRVNLQMLGIVHGEREDAGDFTYYVGVKDRDYQEAGALVGQLDSQRGDVLGLECFGHSARPWVSHMAGMRNPLPYYVHTWEFLTHGQAHKRLLRERYEQTDKNVA